MEASDVVALLDLLEQHGLDVYVDGGWAVDALLGKQTRSHSDLDIAIPHAQVPLLRRLMATRGFHERPQRPIRGNVTSSLPMLAAVDSTFTHTCLMPPVGA